MYTWMHDTRTAVCCLKHNRGWVASLVLKYMILLCRKNYCWLLAWFFNAWSMCLKITADLNLILQQYMILMCENPCWCVVMVKVIFCGHGEERSTRNRYWRCFCHYCCVGKNHEGVFDGMILPTDIVHNDVVRYLTIWLGSWRWN